MPIDPAPFLSTVILASAALVAIIGGLLIARFVGLDSDQQSSRKVLAEASDRLAKARTRAQQAHENVVWWEADSFLRDRDVREAIGAGQTDLDDLRRLADSDLADAELKPLVDEMADDFARARETLAPEAVADQIRAADYDWDKFRKSWRDLPTPVWPAVWRDVFEEIAMALAEADEEQRRAAAESRRRANPFEFVIPDITLNPQTSFLGTLASRTTDAGVTRARRYDELLAADERAQQRVEDFEDELRRLQQARADIVRPDARLWTAVVILVAFTVVGVGIPVWLMAYGPADLSKVRWVFYPFAIVLVVLLAYIVWYLTGLTRRQRQGSNGRGAD